MTSTLPAADHRAADPSRPGNPRPPRLAALTGAGFVVAVLAGNSLTESASGTGALGDLDAMAASTAARAGIVLELVGFVLLLVFVGVLAGHARRSAATGVLATAGAVMTAVKLGSGVELLTALHERLDLDEMAAASLVAQNGVAFGLFWLPFGVFVVATAAALAGPGAIGGGLRWTGTLLGGLTVVAGIAGAVAPSYGVPVPFLLSLLWVAAVSVALAVRRPAATT